MRMHVPADIITYNAVLSACEKGSFVAEGFGCIPISAQRPKSQVP